MHIETIHTCRSGLDKWTCHKASKQFPRTFIALPLTAIVRSRLVSRQAYEMALKDGASTHFQVESKTLMVSPCSLGMNRNNRMYCEGSLSGSGVKSSSSRSISWPWSCSSSHRFPGRVDCAPIAPLVLSPAPSGHSPPLQRRVVYSRRGGTKSNKSGSILLYLLEGHTTKPLAERGMLSPWCVGSPSLPQACCQLYLARRVHCRSTLHHIIGHFLRISTSCGRWRSSKHFRGRKTRGCRVSKVRRQKKWLTAISNQPFFARAISAL